MPVTSRISTTNKKFRHNTRKQVNALSHWLMVFFFQGQGFFLVESGHFLFEIIIQVLKKFVYPYYDNEIKMFKL